MTVPRYRHEREELSPLPPRLSSPGNSLAANILNYLCNMLLGKRESSEEASAQFKSFNLTACGVTTTGDEGGGLAAHAGRLTADRAGLAAVCGCQDFVDRVSGSQIDVSQVDKERKEKKGKLRVTDCKWHFIYWLFWVGRQIFV